MYSCMDISYHEVCGVTHGPNTKNFAPSDIYSIHTGGLSSVNSWLSTDRNGCSKWSSKILSTIYHPPPFSWWGSMRSWGR
ncbi:hypothetical protein BDV29DRAFT_181377 [Aspergillus leporis]|uniref:Uncharacterized protein n=1 Tax=Aspergillus leporis TaxID=41062 RepID=A0A5N5WSJ0_9EURO|nr:hypothetical protein BDV29DRAFT_181377 [Aspergillus leporis]